MTMLARISPRDAVRVAPGVLVACALATVAAAIAPSLRVEPAAGAAPDAFARALTDLAEILLFAASLWLSAATALTVLGALSGTGSLPARLSARVTPRAWRRLLTAALGGAIALAPAATTAQPAGGTDDGPHIAGLRLPDRPSGDVPGTPIDRGAGRPGVRVRPGDTLWDLAASQLPPGSADAAVAVAWHRWYATNRDVIGPDPDLLLPGTRLRSPSDPHERTTR